MNKSFKIITYNVAGLPVTIDLNDLPWYLKPIAWVYKLFKKSTIIPLNTDGPGKHCTKLIGQKFLYSDADIIGVQEDFNYNNVLVDTVYQHYNTGIYSGGLELSRFGELVHFYWKQLPTFRIDGLNLFTKKERVNVLSEKLITWNDHYGYFDHANDALMDKGFRHYVLNIDNELFLDVYNLHMDASWGNDSDAPTEDSEARRKQLIQLAKYINSTNTKNPIIIIGDTNLRERYVSDKMNMHTFISELAEYFNANDAFKVCGSGKVEDDVDKILYINNLKSDYRLTAVDCQFDYTYELNGRRFSDHNPLIAEFTYYKK